MFELKGEKYYTVEEAAELLGFHKQTFRRFVLEKRIAGAMMGNRLIFSETQIQTFVESGTGKRGPRAGIPVRPAKPKKAGKS